MFETENYHSDLLDAFAAGYETTDNRRSKEPVGFSCDEYCTDFFRFLTRVSILDGYFSASQHPFRKRVVFFSHIVYDMIFLCSRRKRL